MPRLIRTSKPGYLLTTIACLYVMLIANGCSSSRSQSVQPLFEMPQEFSSRGTEPMPEKWWQSFNDPQLNVVIEEAMVNNFTIRSAWDRLTQAEQTAIKAGAAMLPSATYSAGAERTRRETSGTTTYTTDYFAGAAAAYEVDLWGRVKSSHEAAVLDARAAQENVDAAAMTLSAAIAKTWYQLAESKEQERVISSQIETNQKILEVIKVQFRQGQVGAADVFSQEQLIQSSRSQLIQVQETAAVLQHQLSILTGKIPGLWWFDATIELVPLGGLPQIDVPAMVIQRRPDVVSAYRTVQAADQRLAYAIATQYPVISLSASAETSGENVSDLFDDWLGNLAANLTGPLFDAGLRKAEVQRTRAVLSEKLNTYSQSVLDALQETEDAITQESHQRMYIESLQKQLALAHNVYERTYEYYLKGQLDYLRVLTALVSMQGLEQRELTARRILIDRRIDLCRSIAGGWPLQRPETAELINQSLFDGKEP
ncbi:MAG: efflux transporter outer membrane subunit [Phycisphaerae bacterium]|nr:efflux transporter outer membrane subunit [Phycisphaerae bacterium]